MAVTNSTLVGCLDGETESGLGLWTEPGPVVTVLGCAIVTVLG